MSNQNCPRCRFILRKMCLRDGNFGMACVTCGWRQKEQGESTLPRTSVFEEWSAIQPASGKQLFAGWILGLLFIFLPYVLPYIIVVEYLAPSVSNNLALGYFPLLLVYLVACFLMRPEMVSENLSWMINDPATDEGKNNRGNYSEAVLMIPGVLIIYVIYSTIRLIKPDRGGRY